MASARVCDFARFFEKCLKWPETHPKLFLEKNCVARIDARVYARVWGHDVDRNDNDFDHEKFE